MEKAYNPKQVEASVSKFWEQKKIVEKITNSRKKGKKWYLLDGPPYVNDTAHVGHAKTTTLKDVWSKFKIMQGHDVWLQPGFDCHGLPVETKVEKELNIETKSDIEKMGADKFIEACLKKVENNEKNWMEMYKSLGAWRGWFYPYLTYKKYFIESAWWTFKELHKKGMLVQGEKPIFWCPRCETALSGYEVTESYMDLKDPGVFLKFKITNEDAYLIVYTTTPWTLPGNVAIAVNPKENYVRAELDGEVHILAEKRVQALEELLGKQYRILEVFKGEELDGLKYEPILNVPVQKTFERKVILSIPIMKAKQYKKHKMKESSEEKEEFGEFVTMDDGSGLVHTAPGHGSTDFEVGKYYKLPVISPVDEKCKFTQDAGKYIGMFVKDADKVIMHDLQNENKLLYHTTITHSYPVCWRCKSPLIFRNSKQWFLKVDNIKNLMIKENEKVRWLPSFAKQRFHNWLEQSIDWCISQQRYWGIPLPIWVCEKCGKVTVIDSEAELREKAIDKLPEELDLHRHMIDNVKFECECGAKMTRVPAIANVWFDSGITPWASIGYPYRNEKTFKKIWPVDLIDESQDQIRGWFYSLMFCGTAAFGKSPYKTVCMNGWVLDEKGEKMSKSLGNVVSAKDGIDQLGADVLRLYLCWETPAWESQKFSFTTAKEMHRALNILWNTCTFFKTYSKGWKPTKLKPTRIEDKWILSRVNSLVTNVTQYMENFEFHKASREIVDFIMNDLSHWYIKIIRSRTWITYKGKDKKDALNILHYILNVLSRTLAPICPFITEEIYQNISKNSVHISGWPKPDKKFIKKDIEKKMQTVKDIVEASNAVRAESDIKLRYVLHSLIISGNKDVVLCAKSMESILCEMANVKSLKFEKSEPKHSVKLNYAVAGKKYGRDVNEIAKLLLEADANELFKGRRILGSFTLSKDDLIFKEIGEAGKEFPGGRVMIDTTITPKLKEEWMVSELIRAVQEARKDMGMDVKNTITLYLPQQFKPWTKSISSETSSRIIFGMAGKKYEFEFEGKKFEFGVKI